MDTDDLIKLVTTFGTTLAGAGIIPALFNQRRRMAADFELLKKCKEALGDEDPNYLTMKASIGRDVFWRYRIPTSDMDDPIKALFICVLVLAGAGVLGVEARPLADFLSKDAATRTNIVSAITGVGIAVSFLTGLVTFATILELVRHRRRVIASKADEAAAKAKKLQKPSK